MEFAFDINQLFTERITLLDHTLAAGRKSAGRPDLQENIATVLDELGKASAKAQQLTAPITSASKLQSQKHKLYLMKDGERNGGRGAVLGFLKVGYKKLFLLDRQGVHIEAEPLCVLDFYICENMQRHGYGLQLFDFMLQHKNVEPVLMAYDRPSPKLLSFLSKHYSLTQSIPQVNNFVVFEGFFLDKSAAQLRKIPPRRADGEIKPYSLMEREVVRQEQRVPPWPFACPQSPQRWASSQFSPYSQSPSASPRRAPRGGQPGQYNPQSPLLEHGRTSRTRAQGLAARSSLYSRHLDPKSATLLQLPGLRAPWAQSLGSAASVSPNPVQTTEIRLACPSSLPAVKTSGQASGSLSDSGTPSSEEDGNAAPGPSGGAAVDKSLSVDNGDRGWTWTVGQNIYSAQWIKYKQQHRSTRPW